MQDANLGVKQIHVQSQNLFLEMQSLKKERTTRSEVCEKVWCMK